MKTAELTGALLNYWAAMAGEEWKHVDTSDTMTLDPSYKGVRLVTYSDGSQAAILQPNNPMRQDPRVFDPSTDWAQGGPIIDRWHIELTDERCDEDDKHSPWSAYCEGPRASTRSAGDTALIAAMRAFVASKFGDEVPDEVSP